MHNVQLGTGKTHTLIEVIRQLTTASASDSKANRVLVCGASNLSVDNILERLLALPVPDKAEKLRVTRIGPLAELYQVELRTFDIISDCPTLTACYYFTTSLPFKFSHWHDFDFPSRELLQGFTPTRTRKYPSDL